MRKIKILVIICLFVLASYTIVLYANYTKKMSLTNEFEYSFSLSQQNLALNQSLVNQNYTEQDLFDMGYEFVSDLGNLRLYLQRKNVNIAVYDKTSDYYWLGYTDQRGVGYTERLRNFIDSGITVEFYDSASLTEVNIPVTHKDAASQITYQIFANGFKANINLSKYGISFDLEVKIDQDELKVLIPHNSIVEIPIKTPAMKYAKEYKLKSVYVFPFFGADNYEINGYAMIPDGSGALIRYENKPFDTAYIKRIYGRDLGIQAALTSGAHLKEESELKHPIFGINHGYNQQAFFAEIHSGFGAAELHSYPFKYNNINLNTTFFVYRTRDQMLIRLSGGEITSIPLINKDPYEFDFNMSYAFLNGEEANYSGMARHYQKSLGLEKDEDQVMDMHIEFVGLDEKPSLFGKEKVVLTPYKEALQIIEELSLVADNLLITYKNYNQYGLYGKTPYKFAANNKLGGAKGFKRLVQGIEDLGNVELSLVASPVVTSKPGVFDQTLKRTSLDMFSLSTKSAQTPRARLLSVTDFSKRILKNAKGYQKYDVSHLSLSGIGDISFSYKGSKGVVYREEMINQVIFEMENLNNYQIGLYEPDSYLYPFINAYYQTPYQANTYAYITDSIPFISLVLSGNTRLYTPYLNYMHNVKAMELKMIEYNLRPSFIITSREGHKLRFTNFEHLLTTYYGSWDDKIVDSYNAVKDLKPFVGKAMLSHYYPLDGLAKVVYENGVVYVNHTDQAILYEGFSIPSFGYLVVEE